MGRGTTPLSMSVFNFLWNMMHVASSHHRDARLGGRTVMFLPGILFGRVDGLPSLFLPLHPFPTIRRIVNLLAPRPGWVGWVCVLALGVTVKGG